MSTSDRWTNLPHVKEFVQKTPWCEVCGRKGRWTPHHRHPKSRADSYDGDVNETSNLTAACPDCHAAYHDAVGQAPSMRACSRDALCRDFLKLKTRWPDKKWERLAPGWLLDSFSSWWCENYVKGRT